MTQPFFIVSSGRSGTQMMEKLLGGLPQVEMHHEYLCTHVQTLAVRYYMGLASLDEVCYSLTKWHGGAVLLSGRDYFGDSSNKLSWLIDGLEQVFPNARYIHLVRDGRKVTSSFLHKLGNECYDDDSTAALQAWVDDPMNNPEPPPEKKYWWNLPRIGSPEASEFRSYNQFQRICFHWAEVNRCIVNSLQKVDAARHRSWRLEDLTAQPEVLRELFAFFGLPFRDEYLEVMRRPHNVSVPRDFPLSEIQTQQLNAIAGDVMETYGYAGTAEYRVEYHPQGIAVPATGK